MQGRGKLNILLLGPRHDLYRELCLPGPDPTGIRFTEHRRAVWIFAVAGKTWNPMRRHPRMEKNTRRRRANPPGVVKRGRGMRNQFGGSERLKLCAPNSSQYGEWIHPQTCVREGRNDYRTDELRSNCQVRFALSIWIVTMMPRNRRIDQLRVNLMRHLNRRMYP